MHTDTPTMYLNLYCVNHFQYQFMLVILSWCYEIMYVQFLYINPWVYYKHTNLEIFSSFSASAWLNLNEALSRETWLSGRSALTLHSKTLHEPNLH